MVLAEDLRQAVLKAAMQGNLTNRLDTDSSVDDLLMNIKNEKSNMVANHIIGKEKPYSTQTKFDEQPYDIPNNWRYERFGTIMVNRDAERIPLSAASRASKEKKYDYYGASGVIDKTDGFLFDKELLLIGEDGANLLSRSTPIAFIASGKYWVNNHAHVLDVCCGLNLKYICYYINSIDLSIYVTGTAQPKMNQSNMNAIWVPIPPIEEQQRIVDKINEIMPKIDEYEKIEKELEAIKKAFPINMKDALLQAAMQGKLTEQLESDSSVDELLLNIEGDRKDKVNSGLIKKDKRLFINYVDDEDMPLAIPNSWRGITLGSIVYKLTDGTHKTPKYAMNGVKFVSVKDISSGKLNIDDTKFITQEEHKELYKRCNPEKGDMLLSKVGTTGVPAIVDIDEEFSLFVSVALLKYNHQFINEQFLYYLLMSPLVQEQVKENTRGIGNKNWVLDFIARTVIVLPSIEEQQRIAERLDTLLPLCEDLKEE